LPRPYLKSFIWQIWHIYSGGIIKNKQSKLSSLNHYPVPKCKTNAKIIGLYCYEVTAVHFKSKILLYLDAIIWQE
jgi:hypothetical protein